MTLLGVGGCGSKPGPDAAMTTLAMGHWIGKSDSSLALDIDSGGTLKITKGTQETNGTWQPGGPGSLNVNVNGAPSVLPFTRRDLNLTITLPGETNPTEFTQM